MGTVARHNAIGCIRPDEIAECWDGITQVDGLYMALWDFVHEYKGILPEVSEEPIVDSDDSIERFWDRLSDEHQTALNTLVEKQFWYELEKH